MEIYRVHKQDSQWSEADYELSWDPQTCTLHYRAEGRDNPKDLWGFDYSYPPKVLDEYTLAEIESLFGREIRQRVCILKGQTPPQK